MNKLVLSTDLLSPVSEVIALEIRRPMSPRPYLYPQLLIGFSYVVASGFMFRLRQIHMALQRNMS